MSRKIRRKKRKLNKKIFIILFLLIFALPFVYYNSNLKAVSKKSEEVSFSIESGQSIKTIINKLKKENLIKNANVALIYAKLNKYTSLKAGEYVLNKNWDVKEILSYITVSKNAKKDDVKVTIIEGDWAKDIANKLAKITDITADEFMNLWNDKEYVRSLMNDYPFITESIFNDNIRILLEGYLFPDTYFISKNMDAKAITKIFLDETLKVYNEFKPQIEKSKLSIHEIFTLASIVQYESGKLEDMKLIAGVFYNRLEKGMKLQSSVTVCYSIDINKGDDWKKCEVNPNFESPYNTYKYAGLPPGPILNSGKEAIDAVLNPTNSEYLFFMADVYGDGKVYYAKTYEEHSKNVRKYLK